MPEELWTEVCKTIQEVVIKLSPKKEMQGGKVLSEEDLQIAEKGREEKGKGERERYSQLNTEFQGIGRRDKIAFSSKHCRQIEECNRMGNTRDLLKKIGDTKENFQAKVGTINNKNSKDLTETIPGTGEPDGLLSMVSHRVRHD